ncbi:MAG: ABC transporter substrate-binding protein [Deltaproteobacteria bacterium]|nr:ABC transporter substrate-binding protein [Deltaproteobacteria bacterium]
MKKSIPVLMAVWLLWGAGPSEAQRIYRIGALVGNDQFVPAIEGFKKRMAELGYQEGKNIKYDVYNARGERDLIGQMAQKLVRDKPDLIVTSSTTATTPVAKLTEGSGIPVVFLSAGNPLVFVKSYSSSGNNLTGISSSEIDLTEKRMELLKELAPGIKKVISLNNPKSENYEANLKATREAAKKLGLGLAEINVTSREEVLKQAKGLLTRKLGDGIMHPPDAIISAAIREITPEINKEKLPSVAVNIGSVKAGALITYAADFFALGQRGAALVDKILKGTKPSDLPIEQPYKLKLVVNLKTAKTIGLKIPKEILLRADEVIE